MNSEQRARDEREWAEDERLRELREQAARVVAEFRAIVGPMSDEDISRVARVYDDIATRRANARRERRKGAHRGR